MYLCSSLSLSLSLSRLSVGLCIYDPIQWRWPASMQRHIRTLTPVNPERMTSKIVYVGRMVLSAIDETAQPLAIGEIEL